MNICPKCERTLPHPNAWHYCRKVDLDSLFVGKSDEVVLIADTILAELIGWEGVSFSPTKNCVVFVRNKTFLVLKPLKNQVNLKFYLTEVCHEFPIVKSIPWNSKYENHIRLQREAEINAKVLRFIRDSYEIS
ncbi:DUF5655 domain-containing protein [Flavilitoribacter nigricans]|uniref:DUF5655 domain-containing protein n=1 Tax=Flavilitoribacter nigricans (strain ATCC 23147 / DSM 23189 / NBRC 102662 / NCIMB 1420 / SS-2) TaxID=1122177 RepID=A0A2D0N3X1_FLAN2|nr:DUF5655 domain-containing protein [Flavilitoribacter nigricans]PHN03137.1 hypothetical protein CRP01_29095 [Flavilitoribacter nigricans DSM 23189 = NBRC 102662]